jgi:hypothetical protein
MLKLNFRDESKKKRTSSVKILQKENTQNATSRRNISNRSELSQKYSHIHLMNDGGNFGMDFGGKGRNQSTVYS